VRPQSVAQLVAAGVTRHVLAGPRWRRTLRGLYVPATGVPSTPTQRLVEAAALLPAGGAMGGWAAAYAWGADLLDGRDDHTLREQPVLPFLPPGQHRAALPGVRYGQQQLRPVEIVTRSGLVLTTPSRTASDLVRGAPDLTEAVVALDALLGAALVEVACRRRWSTERCTTAMGGSSAYLTSSTSTGTSTGPTTSARSSSSGRGWSSSGSTPSTCGDTGGGCSPGSAPPGPTVCGRDRWVLASRRSDRSSRAGDRGSLLLDRPRLSP